jgi:RHH-type proline utilization regulon transcriptional repressor/proline dehydrogenase/delta 1-pyrroline-5-carboxylate dehydrogenase
VEETEEELAEVVRQRQTDRVRCAAPGRVSQAVLEAAGESGICVAARPVLMEGRVELLWYLEEQSVSIDFHRYGNLGMRAGEQRAAVL